MRAQPVSQPIVAHPYVSEALERQAEAFEFLTRAALDPTLRPAVEASERVQWLTDLHALSRAQTHYWNDHTVEVVTALQADFVLEDLVASRALLTCDVAWHYFAGRAPFEIEEVRRPGSTAPLLRAPVKALTWYWFSLRDQPYLGATAWCHRRLDDDTWATAGPLVPTLWVCVDQDAALSTVPSDDRLQFKGIVDARTRWEQRQLLQFIACAATFLRQELLQAPTVTAERAARKRIARRSAVAAFATHGIQVVQLRKVTPKPAGAGETRGEPVDHAFQWTVRGHVRRQWYATLQQHLPIWINPFIKGPEGRPLKPRTTPIFSVTR